MRTVLALSVVSLSLVTGCDAGLDAGTNARGSTDQGTQAALDKPDSLDAVVRIAGPQANCAAVVVDPHWVLTVESCISGAPEQSIVEVGHSTSTHDVTRWEVQDGLALVRVFQPLEVTPLPLLDDRWSGELDNDAWGWVVGQAGAELQVGNVVDGEKCGWLHGEADYCVRSPELPYDGDAVLVEVNGLWTIAGLTIANDSVLDVGSALDWIWEVTDTSVVHISNHTLFYELGWVQWNHEVRDLTVPDGISASVQMVLEPGRQFSVEVHGHGFDPTVGIATDDGGLIGMRWDDAGTPIVDLVGTGRPMLLEVQAEDNWSASGFDLVFVTDRDEDGFPMDEDCNDDDASVHPWADEVANGEDTNCDGIVE